MNSRVVKCVELADYTVGSIAFAGFGNYSTGKWFRGAVARYNSHNPFNLLPSKPNCDYIISFKWFAKCVQFSKITIQNMFTKNKRILIKHPLATFKVIS